MSLFENNKIDIDECELNLDNCEMGCINTIGSFRCSCYEGYELINSTSCIKSIYVVKIYLYRLIYSFFIFFL